MQLRTPLTSVYLVHVLADKYLLGTHATIRWDLAGKIIWRGAIMGHERARGY